MDLGLKDRIAAITGGSEGIGLATAKLLAAHGAKVAICGRDPDKLERAAASIREAGGDVLAVQADVSKAEDCNRFIEQTTAHFGGLDILINNAGTAAAKPFEDVDDAAWAFDFDLKIMHAIRCTRAALPHLRRSQQAAIVNVLNTASKNPPARSFPTSVSRAAGLALTKGLSKELGADGIRVNAVCIGLVRSGQIERRWQNDAPELSWEEWSAKQAQAQNIPLGRLGDTDEAARAITFLVSGAASYITGVALNIDGGSSPSV